MVKDNHCMVKTVDDLPVDDNVTIELGISLSKPYSRLDETRMDTEVMITPEESLGSSEMVGRKIKYRTPWTYHVYAFHFLRMRMAAQLQSEPGDDIIESVPIIAEKDHSPELVEYMSPSAYDTKTDRPSGVGSPCSETTA